MKTGDTMRTAFRIWLFTVIINAMMIAFYIGEWWITAGAIIVGAFISLPIPFFASYCLKFAVKISKSFAARFANSFFFLVLLAVLFWFIILAITCGPAKIFDVMFRERESTLLIGSNFLSILIGCVCSTKQIDRLDDVTSEESFIS
jgi:hypothetical protein